MEKTNLIARNVALTKESNDAQIRAYFEGVQRLYRSGEQYPVNLDDVWMLVYSEKSKAVRALKRDFYENDDFLPIAPNGERSNGRFNTETQRVTYMLSVPCFEYFIAKKVRKVFEVYRNVFKKVATGEVKVVPAMQPRSGAELMLMYAQQMVEQERKIASIESKASQQEQRITEIEERINGTVPYTTIIGFGNRFGLRIPREKASALGRVATNLCKKYGFEMGQVQDPRFGWVKTYPDGVLSETFSKYYPNMSF